MVEEVQKKGKLISDDGVYDNVKIRQEKIFIAFCRVVSVALLILGALAILAGAR